MNLDRVTFHLECVFLALGSYSELATKRGLIDLALKTFSNFSWILRRVKEVRFLVAMYSRTAILTELNEKVY